VAECALEHDPCGLAHHVLVGALSQSFGRVRLPPPAHVAFLGSEHRRTEARGLHAPLVLTAQHVQGITRCEPGERCKSPINQPADRLDADAGVRYLRERPWRGAERLPYPLLEPVELRAGIASRIAPGKPWRESGQALAGSELAQLGEDLRESRGEQTQGHRAAWTHP
jgi:hypothetical protein